MSTTLDDKAKIDCESSAAAGDTTTEEHSVVKQEVESSAEADCDSRVTMALSRSIEPPNFINKFKTYDQYKNIKTNKKNII